MKLSAQYVLRELAGKGLLMPEHVNDPALRTESGALRAITLSDSAYWLIKNLEGHEFTEEQAIDSVCEHFAGVDRAEVETDMAKLFDTLRSCGVVEP